MPTVEQLTFYVLAAGALLSSAAVVLPPMGRNPIHSAISLIISFFFLAGCYAMMHAHLLSVVQIIVYAGAIMVLFTFVIMLLNLGDDELGEPKVTATKVFGGLAVLFVVGKLMTVFSVVGEAGVATWQAVDKAGEAAGALHYGVNMFAAPNEGFGSVTDVGRMVYTSFMVPFELVSVLLLVAAVGAVVVAKRTLVDSGAPNEGDDT